MGVTLDLEKPSSSVRIPVSAQTLFSSRIRAFEENIQESSIAVYLIPFVTLVIFDDKTTFRLSWLGVIIDSNKGNKAVADECAIEVEPKKYARLCDEIEDFLKGSESQTVILPDTSTEERIISYCGKSLERIRGKCVSHLLVVPHPTMFIVEMTDHITWCYAHNTYEIPANRVRASLLFQELSRWTELRGIKLERSLFRPEHKVVSSV